MDNSEAYLNYITEYIMKANKLLNILSKNPVKNQDKIKQTRVIIETATHLKEEYMKDIFHSLAEFKFPIP